MSYVVLARKYRPRSFEQMVGQEHVVRALSSALQQQRLHHAYLFTGTRGIGKTTVSRILAKSLNCTGPDGRGGALCGHLERVDQVVVDAGLAVAERAVRRVAGRAVHASALSGTDPAWPRRRPVE